MAKKKYILYPGQVLTGDTNFPNGKAVDVSSPGAADGTPWKEDLINERFGFEEALLYNSDLTTNDTAETKLNSQYYQSVQEQAAGRASILKVAAGSTSTNVTLEPFLTGRQEFQQYFEGMIVRFKRTLPILAGASLGVSGAGGSIVINSTVGTDNSKDLTQGSDPIVTLILVDFNTPAQRWEILSNGRPYITDVDYGSDNIINQSDLPGTSVTDALNLLYEFRVGTFSSSTDGPQTINFNAPFPINCFHVSITMLEPNNASTISLASLPSRTGFIADRASSVDGFINCSYMAIGN